MIERYNEVFKMGWFASARKNWRLDTALVHPDAALYPLCLLRLEYPDAVPLTLLYL